MDSLTQTPVWKAIDSAAYLFLARLFEPDDNTLTVVLEEAIANKAKKGPTILPGGIELPGDSCPIEPTEETRVFALLWKNYVAYNITEEMHGFCGNYTNEEFTGRLLRLYTRSNYLDFIAKDTGAHFEPYHHFKIACQNHNLDIVATSFPKLKVFQRNDRELTLDATYRF